MKITSVNACQQSPNFKMIIRPSDSPSIANNLKKAFGFDEKACASFMDILRDMGTEGTYLSKLKITNPLSNLFSKNKQKKVSLVLEHTDFIDNATSRQSFLTDKLEEQVVIDKINESVANSEKNFVVSSLAKYSHYVNPEDFNIRVSILESVFPSICQNIQEKFGSIKKFCDKHLPSKK